MALRAGLPFLAPDGTVATDAIVILQIAAQVPNLAYDSESGDQRGCSIFMDGDRGRAFAGRFLSAARWNLQCSPTTAGLCILPSSLYAYASRRHGPAYWELVRPKLQRAKEKTMILPAKFRPATCTSSFWYDGADTGAAPTPVELCSHIPPPAVESPLTEAIDAVNSITECRTYDEWRARVDTAVEAVKMWLEGMASSGENNVLPATNGAAPRFLDLLATTLEAVLND
ncbi:hypothetical protein O9K51_01774 [Purpureocillium lavendulum]|uniref:Uncharacterized protein n=1 Tax=Purpureocillium lavendulum TaxID=1247861 RepID=A0AB34G633_9HYPO|nr:hypothetical protein O9K51_01774 [Purpureocillium lavendulum]